MDWQEMYDFLRDEIGVSRDTLDLAFALGGCNTATGEYILYYYTGYRTFESIMEDMEE